MLFKMTDLLLFHGNMASRKKQADFSKNRPEVVICDPVQFLLKSQWNQFLRFPQVMTHADGIR